VTNEEITIIEFSHPKTFHIFGRNNDGSQFHKVDSTFHPYFYVDADIQIPATVSKWILNIETGPKTLQGTPTKKIVFQFMNDKKTFKQMRESFTKTYEDDVVFSTRYLIDHPNLKFTKNYRVATLDIETSMEFPIKDIRNQIRAITFHDNYLNRYVTYCVAGRYEKVEKSSTWNIYFVLNEQDLLNKIAMYFKTLTPDVVTGWNSEGFDLPYIYSRFITNGLDVKQLSPLNEVYLKTNVEDSYAMNNNKIYGQMRIKGIQCLDSMKVLQKATGGALHSYSLDNVSKLYLKEEKLKFDMGLDELYKNDIMKYCEYNKRDVELNMRLNKTPGILNYFISMQQYSPVNLVDMFYVSRPIDNLILRTYHNEIAFPSKRKNLKEKYVGAFVKDPFVGIKDNVAVFDVRAMYTNLQISLNISVDTKSPDGDIEIHGVKFKSQPEGIIPKLLRSLQDERNKLKAQLKEHLEDSVEYQEYNDRQNSVKTLLNSFYGVSGSPYYRNYDKDVAESITLAGQDVITEISKIVESCKHKILYNDTDSAMVELTGICDGVSANLVAENLKNYVNEQLAINMEVRTKRKCTVGIEFEKLFSKFMMIGSKKKYCGYLVYKNGKEMPPTFFEMGFEGRKRDSTRITKLIERECLICLLNGGGQQDILEISRKAYRNIKKEDVRSLAIKFKLSKNIDEYKNKNAQHIRAIHNANKFYPSYYEVGDTVDFVFVKRFDGKLINDVMALNDNTPIDKIEIDFERTSDRNITKKLTHIFEAFGWDVFSLDVNQTQLGGYM